MSTSVMTQVKAFAANEPGQPFEPFEYSLPSICPDEVEVEVAHCGICHSDLSMLNNDWGLTSYPFVGGHEIIGKVCAVGEHVPNLKVGDCVGIGWFSSSCMHCPQCLGGNHNLCPSSTGMIIDRHGGFAEKVRCHWGWTTKLIDGIDPKTAGPLFCGGITVYNPIVQFDVKPFDCVGVIGIGGLGHLAIEFLKAWGCEVTAFSTNPAKETEAKKFGAHYFVNTKDSGALEKLQGKFNFILNTTNVALDWDAYVMALAPKGRFHSVGAIPNFGINSFFPMIFGQRSVSGSPLGSPATVAKMLEFCARHGIAPQTEHFPLEKINDAFEKLKQGNARYRLVLDVCS